jgi:hypothetical protein
MKNFLTLISPFQKLLYLSSRTGDMLPNTKKRKTNMVNRPTYVCWLIENFDHRLSFKMRPWLHGCILLCVELFCFPFLHLLFCTLFIYIPPPPFPRHNPFNGINLRWNSWRDNFVEGSGTDLEISQTWGFYLRFLSLYIMIFMNKLEFSSLIDYLWNYRGGIVFC